MRSLPFARLNKTQGRKQAGTFRVFIPLTPLSIEREELDVQAIQRFWAKSVLNKVMLLMNFSLIFCCCGWTGRIGGEVPAEPVARSLPAAVDRAAEALSPVRGYGR